MATMTSNHSRLIRKLTVNAEKYSRTRQQADYLSKCLEEKLLPRSLNFVKKAKSQLLWENSKREEIFDTLFNASIRLVELQCKDKIEKYEELDKEATNLKKRLKEEVTEEIYDYEMGKLKRHFARICAKGNLQKQRKFRRDAEETQQIKELRNSRALPVKKKSRRFVRKDLAQNVQSRFYQEEHLVHTEVHTEVNDNNPALNVLIVSEQEQPEVHISRIHGKVKNLRQ